MGENTIKPNREQPAVKRPEPQKQAQAKSPGTTHQASAPPALGKPPTPAAAVGLPPTPFKELKKEEPKPATDDPLKRYPGGQGGVVPTGGQPEPDKSTLPGAQRQHSLNDPNTVVAIESPFRRFQATKQAPESPQQLKQQKEQQARAQVSAWPPAFQQKMLDKLAERKGEGQRPSSPKTRGDEPSSIFLGQRYDDALYTSRESVKVFTQRFDKMREAFGFDPRLHGRGSKEEQDFLKAREDYWGRDGHLWDAKDHIVPRYLQGTLDSKQAWRDAMKSEGFEDKEISEILDTQASGNAAEQTSIRLSLALMKRRIGHPSMSPEAQRNRLALKIIEGAYGKERLAKDMAQDELSGVRNAEEQVHKVVARQTKTHNDTSGIPPKEKPDTDGLAKAWADMSPEERQKLYQESRQELIWDRTVDQSLLTELAQINSRTNMDHLQGLKYTPGNPADRSGYAASRDMLDTIAKRYGFDPRIHPPGSPQEKRFLAQRRAYEESRTDFLKTLKPEQRQPYIERELQVTLGSVRRLEETFARQQIAYKDAGWYPDSKLPYVSSEGFLAELHQRGAKQVSDRDLHLGLQTLDKLKERFPKDRPSFQEQFNAGGSDLYRSWQELQQQEYDRLAAEAKVNGSYQDTPAFRNKLIAESNVAVNQQLRAGTPQSFLKKPFESLTPQEKARFLQDNFRFGVEKMEHQLRDEMVQRVQNLYFKADKQLYDVLKRQGFLGATGDWANSWGTPGGWVLNSDYSTHGMNSKLKDMHQFAQTDIAKLKGFKGSHEEFQKLLQERTQALTQKMQTFDRDIQEFLKSQNRWEDGLSTLAATSVAMAATVICPPAGPATFMAAVAVGAGLGATTKVGVKGLDAMVGHRPYTAEELQRDVVAGSIAGGTTVLGNVGAKYLTSALLGEQLVSSAPGAWVNTLMREALEDSLDGFMSNGAGTLVEGAMEGKSIDENLRDSLNSAALGMIVTPIVAPAVRVAAKPLAEAFSGGVDAPGGTGANVPDGQLGVSRPELPGVQSPDVKAPAEIRVPEFATEPRFPEYQIKPLDPSVKAEAPTAKVGDTPSAKAPESVDPGLKYPEIGSSQKLTPEARERAIILRDHLEKGFELMRQGKYKEASRHFNNPQIAKKAGYHYNENNFFVLDDLTEEGLQKTVDGIAGRSWFQVNGKDIYPSTGEVFSGFDPAKATDAEKAIVDRFYKEVAMIKAEEWTHAYQDLMGANVSKKGQLLPKHPQAKIDDHELDVGQFFKEQGLEPSEQYLRRYGRGEAIKGLESKLPAKTAESITRHIDAMKPGDTQTIGRSGDIKVDYLLDKVSREQTTVKALEDGHYEISDGANGKPSRNGTFFEDEHGVWQRITDPVALKPGQRVRMGTEHEFTLPEAQKTPSAETVETLSPKAGDTVDAKAGDLPAAGEGSYRHRLPGEPKTRPLVETDEAQKLFQQTFHGKPMPDNIDFRTSQGGSSRTLYDPKSGKITVEVGQDAQGKISMDDLFHEMQHVRQYHKLNQLKAQATTPAGKQRYESYLAQMDQNQAHSYSVQKGREIVDDLQAMVDGKKPLYKDMTRGEAESKLSEARQKLAQAEANYRQDPIELESRIEEARDLQGYYKNKADNAKSNPEEAQRLMDRSNEYGKQAEQYKGLQPRSTEPVYRRPESKLSGDEMGEMGLFTGKVSPEQSNAIQEILNKPEYVETRKALRQWATERAKGNHQGLQRGTFTNKLAKEIAAKLGFTEHGMNGNTLLFIDRAGRFLSPDCDGHSGLGWKVHLADKGRLNMQFYDTADILGRIYRPHSSR